MIKGFRQKLKERQEKVNSLVCVGLDPLESKIPDSVKRTFKLNEKRVGLFLQQIIDATAPHACMFKPQSAHYESIFNGRKILRDIVDYIHENYPDIPVFLDCKRGDVGRTQRQYGIAHFDLDKVDGMNYNPYMGKDTLLALTNEDVIRQGKALVGLCFTSNKSARQIQNMVLKDGRYLYQHIAGCIRGWSIEEGVEDNAGLVVASAYEKDNHFTGYDHEKKVFSEHLKDIRNIVGNELWFLIPGIGTQGGVVKETMEAAFKGYGSIAINSSSGIIFASQDEDYAEAAGQNAKELKDQINKYL